MILWILIVSSQKFMTIFLDCWKSKDRLEREIEESNNRSKQIVLDSALINK